MEEDEEDEKYKIFSWALGKHWRSLFPKFLQLRDQLWKSMNYRGIVSRRTCEEVFTMCPDHPAWERGRQQHHAGASRNLDKEAPTYGRTSPINCQLCSHMRDNASSLTKIPTYTLQSSTDYEGQHYMDYSVAYDLLDEIELTAPKESSQLLDGGLQWIAAEE